VSRKKWLWLAATAVLMTQLVLGPILGPLAQVAGFDVYSASAAPASPNANKVNGNGSAQQNQKRMTPAERLAAAKRAAAARAKAGVKPGSTPQAAPMPNAAAAPQSAGVATQSVNLGMPDYFGTTPNYANSPLPLASAS
jgi:hypothetical protein